MPSLRGTITHQRVFDNFWSITTLRVSDEQHGTQKITVTGNLGGAGPGDSIEVTGDFVEHKEYGRQFRAKQCDIMRPNDRGAVVAWLEHQLPNIGKKRAVHLLDTFGVDGLWDVIENDPGKLKSAGGLTDDRIEQIIGAYARGRADRDQMIQFREWGITPYQAGVIKKKLGDDAMSKIQENPYVLAEHVRGFGFVRADAVAMRMGIKKDHPGRIRAGILHKMREAEMEGHCFVPARKLADSVAVNLLKIGRAGVAMAINHMLKDADTPALVGVDDECKRVSLRGTGAAEVNVAQWFKDRRGDW